MRTKTKFIDIVPETAGNVTFIPEASRAMTQ